eukprot:6066743-Amphidinium_carterae.1
MSSVLSSAQSSATRHWGIRRGARIALPTSFKCSQSHHRLILLLLPPVTKLAANYCLAQTFFGFVPKCLTFMVISAGD